MAAKLLWHRQFVRLSRLIILAGLSLYPAVVSAAEDLSALDKGHRILIQRGLQIQGQCFYQLQDLGLTSYTFDPQPYFAANFTGINWHYRPVNVSFAAAYPTFPWARWTIQTGESNLTPAEEPYRSAFVAFQYKDENSLNLPEVRADFKAWFDAAHPNFPNTILYTNQLAFDATDANLRTYMSECRPDMLCMDSYRWKIGNTEGTWHLFSDMQRYRRYALLGNDGTGAKPIPYGLFPHTFHGENLWRDPSESELRVNHFGAWAFGYTYTSIFTYNYSTSSLFTPGYNTANPMPNYHQLKEVNRQGRNLGPALVRLLSKDVRFIAGQSKDAGGNPVANPNPIDVPTWQFGVNDPYLRGWAVTNLGTKNDGLPGDVILSWFKVLDESFDGTAHSNQHYLMVLNALRDPNGSAADCRQRIQLNFDFGSSGIQAVQRLNRKTGQMEYLYLEVIPDSGGRRRLVLDLDGGTGDLFKFYTGAPFVGLPPDTTPPGSVTGLTATAGAKRVVLAWTNPGNADFTGTLIRRKANVFPSGPTDGELVVDQAGSPGASQSFVDTGVTGGVTYRYAAFAHDHGLNYAPAAQASATPTVTADFDMDGDVDQDDFGVFQSCLSNTRVSPLSTCGSADFDGDEFVTANDLTLFRACMGGAQKPPGC